MENSYFDRATDNGTYDIEIVDEEGFSTPNAHFSLDDGDAFLSLSLPPEAKPGDRFTIETRIDDPTLVEPFVDLIRFTVTEKVDRQGGSRKKKKKGGTGAGKQGKGQGITLPEVVSVKEGDANWERYKFDSDTSCHVVSELIPVDGKDVLEHTFYINVSNTSLLTEMKYRNVDARMLEAKFKYGNVLLGLAILHDSESSSNGDGSNEEKEVPVADQIRQFTRAVGPVLLPMIDQLSGLNESELMGYGLDNDS